MIVVQLLHSTSDFKTSDYIQRYMDNNNAKLSASICSRLTFAMFDTPNSAFVSNIT